MGQARKWSRNDIESRILAGENIVLYRDTVLRIPPGWLKTHPGGDLAILHFVGRDAGDEISAFHCDETLSMMVQRYSVGTVDLASEPDKVWRPMVPPIMTGWKFQDGAWMSYAKEREGLLYPGTRPDASGPSRADLVPPPSSISLVEQDRLSREFQHLHQTIKDAGLYQCRFVTGYGPEIARYVGVGLFSAFAYCQNWLVISAIALGLLWHQLTFTAHDLGHLGVSHDWTLDRLLSIFIADFVGGLSIGWWVDNHNVHHLVTNHPSHDPDIQHIPFFAISSHFLSTLYSSYYNRSMLFDPLAKVALSIQHKIFYFVMLFARFNLYANSYGFLYKAVRKGNRKAKGGLWCYWTEIAGLAAFWAWYGLVLYHCGSWQRALAFMVISHAVTSPLHVQIVLSHFTMSTEDLGVTEGFVHRQLRTTTDVVCPPSLQFIHGGLHLQVTHHLFPRLPRHNLRDASMLVKQFCKENDLTYHEFGFLHGNGEVLSVLKNVAEQVNVMAKVAKAEADEQMKHMKLRT